MNKEIATSAFALVKQVKDHFASSDFSRAQSTQASALCMQNLCISPALNCSQYKCFKNKRNKMELINISDGNIVTTPVLHEQMIQ